MIYRSDGTKVSKEVKALLKWLAGEPNNPATEHCFGYMAGAMVDIPCDGWPISGGAMHLSYMCEARPIEVKDKTAACIFPFKFKGKTYDGCVQPTPEIGIGPQTAYKPLVFETLDFSDYLSMAVPYCMY